MAKRDETKATPLVYLGTRRPSSLADVDQYAEVKHDKVEPRAHDNATGIVGESMTGREKR